MEDIYVKGIVSTIGSYNSSYGELIYYISDDGTTTNQLEIYDGYYLNNERFTSDYANELMVGDEVIVYGTFTNYQGTLPEGAMGATYIYSLTRNGGVVEPGTGGDTPTGHGYEADDPYTVSELIPIIEALAANGTISKVYVKGIVSYVENISVSYGNMTYYISDDGSTTNQLCIYRGKALGGAAPTSEDEIQDGDEVIVYGTFVNYYGNTPEGQTGETYIYSLEKGNGGTVEPEPEVELGGVETFVNGSFEEWENGYPVGWKSTTSASNATLTQSSDAYEGNYSVEIPRDSSNRRLASKEFLLPADTYNVSFYAKSSDADGMAHIATGYAPWDSEEDKMGTYVYSDYYDIPADEWKLIEYTFVLEETTQVNLVIMNQHDGTSAVLIDNYTITSDNFEDGITAVAVNAAYAGAHYNLAGQKVSDSYKGIVICNGKKYLKK